MLALPPIDEYAELDLAGVRFDPVELYPAPPSAVPYASAREAQEAVRTIMRQIDESDGVVRRRAWKVRLPEQEAFGRFFPSRLGWRKTFAIRQTLASHLVQNTAFENDETGDAVMVTQKIAATKKGVLVIELSESKASRQPWTRVKRCARRTFLRRFLSIWFPSRSL